MSESHLTVEQKQQLIDLLTSWINYAESMHGADDIRRLIESVRRSKEMDARAGLRDLFSLPAKEQQAPSMPPIAMRLRLLEKILDTLYMVDQRAGGPSIVIDDRIDLTPDELDYVTAYIEEHDGAD